MKPIILSLVTGLLLFVFLEGVKRFAKKNINKKPFFSSIIRFMPLIELVTWVIFVIWVIHLFFVKNPYLPVVYLIAILILTTFLSLLLLRDYFAGILIKIRFKIREGQHFETEAISGIVQKANRLYMEIRTDNGYEYKVPYSKIDQGSIRSNLRQTGENETSLSFAITKNIPWEEIQQIILEVVLNSPWSSYKKVPVIKKTEEKNDVIQLEIMYKANGETKHKQFLKDSLKAKFGKDWIG
jgi:hypothetical protein